MKKYLMMFAAVFCCAMTVWGQTISEQEAKERALQFLNAKTSIQNRARSFSRVPKGEQNSFKFTIDDIWFDDSLVLSIIEQLRDGRSKQLLELTIQPYETIEYPNPTGVSSVAVSKDDSKVFYNLNGQRFNGQPAKGGIYIQKGKKISIN